MFSWVRGKRAAPLTGAPAVRRLKAYSARSGHVYEYYYAGQRRARREGEWGAEFVFDVSADRKDSFSVSVFVSEPAVAGWQEAHNRSLTPTERYAIAKMALFQAFDERDSPADMREEIRARTADIEAIIETLGIG